MSENLTTNEGPNYLTSKGFSMTAAVWMIVATLVGLTAAIELVAPDLAANVAWLLFSRLRPMHVNLVLFLFVVPGLLAAVFYMFPRLLNTPIFSDKLGFVTVVIWNIMLVAVV
ncbi:MAG: cbb3-type cytochrome c oxidase subunit I, partial [bacterium]